MAGCKARLSDPIHQLPLSLWQFKTPVHRPITKPSFFLHVAIKTSVHRSIIKPFVYLWQSQHLSIDSSQSDIFSCDNQIICPWTFFNAVFLLVLIKTSVNRPIPEPPCYLWQSTHLSIDPSQSHISTCGNQNICQ